MPGQWRRNPVPIRQQRASGPWAQAQAFVPIGWEPFDAKDGGGATYDFADLKADRYIKLRFHLIGLRPAVDGDDLWLRVSTDGGATYVASGTPYRYAIAITADSGAAAITASTGANQIILVGNIGNATTKSADAVVDVYNHASAALHKRFNAYGSRTSTTAQTAAIDASGVYGAVTPVNAIRFMFSSGNIAEGTIIAEGLRAR